MELNLLNLLLVLLAAWLAGNLSSKLGYPAVLGELLAGVILGPPLLGLLHGSPALTVLANVGVLIMMLYIGMEVEPRDLKKVSWAGVLAAVGGFIAPFVLAFLVVRWFGGTATTGVFVGIAAGITSLATKSRMLIDLRLMDTRMGHVMMAGALIADTLSLIIFAAVLGVTNSGQFDWLDFGLVILRILVFFGATTLIGLKVFPWLGRRLSEAGMTGRTFNFTLVLLIAVAFGELAELSGLHSVVGAFMAGLFLRENVLGRTLSQSLMHAVQDASIGFLAPIFFMTAGFAVSFSVFQEDLGLVLGVLIAAIVGKTLGTALIYLMSGNGWREALTIGAAMNGRGGVDIILSGIALEMGLISPEIFSVLVFMALITTSLVPFFLKWGTNVLKKRGELVRKDEERKGILIIGAGPLAIKLAGMLKNSHPVWLLDSNLERCQMARDEGFTAVCGNALQENILSEAHAAEADTLITLTPNAEINSLVAQLAKDVFGIPNIHISPSDQEGVGQTAMFERLGATRLFGVTLALNLWDYWISLDEVRETRYQPVEKSGRSVSDFLEEMDRKDKALPFVIMRKEQVLPLHENSELEEGDIIVLLLHEQAGESFAVTHDRFDRLVEEAPLLDIRDSLLLDDFFELASQELAPLTEMDAESIKKLLLERELDSSSIIAPGLAVPHAVIDKPGHFHLVMARARKGVVFPREQEKPKTLFVLLRSKEERTFHLRALSAIAQIVQDPMFDSRWEETEDMESLRELILKVERKRYHEAERTRNSS